MSSDNPPQRRLVSHEGHTVEIAAWWRWPDHPAIEVLLDGAPVAFVEYLPASASAHWFVSWERPRDGHPDPLALIALATWVPEDLAADAALRDAALAMAVDIVAGQMEP